MRTPRYLIGVWFACFLGYVCVGISIPGFPFLLQAVLAGDIPQDALALGWILSLTALLLLFIAPLVGHLGDCYGYRKLLFLKFSMGAIGFFIYSFAESFTALLLGHLFVMFLTLVPVSAFALYATLVRKPDRVRVFGYLNAAQMGGYVVGIALEGSLYDGNFVETYYLAMALTMLALLVIFGLGKENRAAGPRGPFGLIRDSELALLWKVARGPASMFLIGLFFFAQTGEKMIESNWDYYSDIKFEWTPAELSYFLLTIYGLATVVAALMLAPLVRIVGETGALMIGFSLATIGLFGFSLTDSEGILYIFALFWAAQALIAPLIKAQLSRSLPGTSQGKLQGALLGVSSLAVILVNTLFIEIFYIFSEGCNLYCFPGAPYFIIGTIYLLCLITVYRSRRNLIFTTKTKI